MIVKPRGLLHVTSEVDPEHEEDYNRWFWEEHVQERMAIPGFLSARRYIATMGQPKYLAMYELESAEVLETEAYKHAYNNPTPWTRRLRPHYRSTRTFYTETKPKG